MLRTHKIKEILQKHIDTNTFIVDIKNTPNSKISVFIDNFDGITLSQCAKIHKKVITELTEINDNHTLEISSPGITNNLKVWQQYAKIKNKKITIHTTQNQSYTGTLTNATENIVKIELNNKQEHTFTYDQIKKAKQIINFN